MVDLAAAEVVLASRNQKKIGEMAALLGPYGISVSCVGDFPNVPEVVEDGDSFAANAAKKATQTARCISRWTIGEDSGLMVDALDGAPGIFSARYSGEGATDSSNNSKLIEALADVPTVRRGAQYVCSVAVSDPDGRVRFTVERTCRGCIVDEPSGKNGFGYDPHFLIPEYHRTFGELPAIVKSQLSHRARAFHELVPALAALLVDSSSC